MEAQEATNATTAAMVVNPANRISVCRSANKAYMDWLSTHTPQDLVQFLWAILGQENVVALDCSLGN